jgi:hypothetical protein
MARKMLRGTNQSELAWMSGKQMSKFVGLQDSPYLATMSVGPSASFMLMQCKNDQKELESVEMQSVITEFEDVFDMPPTLPP